MADVTYKEEYGPAKGLYVVSTGAKIGQAIKGPDGLYYLHLENTKYNWPSSILDEVASILNQLNRERIAVLNTL